MSHCPVTWTVLRILQHALGRDEYGHGTDYRNHFVAGEGSEDVALCREAVAHGLMREHAPRAISGGDPIFTVTDAGKAYIAERSPKPPKLTRGQRRYQAWLTVSDICGVPFGEWLKSGGGAP